MPSLPGQPHPASRHANSVQIRGLSPCCHTRCRVRQRPRQAVHAVERDLEPGLPRSTGLGPVRPPPFLACTWAESSTTRETSSTPRSVRASSTARCRRSYTPARIQIVDFDTPKHGGSDRHAQPLTSTYTAAANTTSSGADRLPPPCGRTETAGRSGCATSHSPSGTIHDHSTSYAPGTTRHAI